MDFKSSKNCVQVGRDSVVRLRTKDECTLALKTLEREEREKETKKKQPASQLASTEQPCCLPTQYFSEKNLG